MAFHAGAAPVTPDTSHIGAPSALPTHTPTVYREVKPTAQLSRMSLLVPVLTALKLRVASTLSKPKVRVRALLSARMSVTMKLASALKTRLSAFVGRWSARSKKGRATPPFASAR